jgi:GNAT superfamily N-acetyltransferase
VSNDPGRMDLEVIHDFLSRSYWARGIPRDLVRRSIDGSIPYGIFHGTAQVGFGRVISDRATFAYVADVFVLETHRGNGLATWMMDCMLATPALADLRRWLLFTRDAHAVYRRVGFGPPARPDNIMEKVRAHPYVSSPEP